MIDHSSIIAAVQAGNTDREVARMMRINHKTVASHRALDGLRPNGKARRYLEMVGDTHARCSRCDKVKLLSGWLIQRPKSSKPYRMSFCNECRLLAQNATMNRSAEANLRTRWTRLRVRASRIGVDCSISFDDFYGQWQQQKGLCFYTDEPMLIDFGKGKNAAAASVDKVEPRFGYVIHNVVFSTTRVNTIKHDVSLSEMKIWMPGWFERVAAWRAAGIPCAQVAPGAF